MNARQRKERKHRLRVQQKRYRRKLRREEQAEAFVRELPNVVIAALQAAGWHPSYARAPELSFWVAPPRATDGIRLGGYTLVQAWRVHQESTGA